MAPSLVPFVSPVWVVWSLPLMLAAAPPANAQGGGACGPASCGNLTISEPFGIVLPEEATQAVCGSLGFQVICDNNTPYLGYRRTGYYKLQILAIFYGNSSLLAADMRKLEDFTNLNCTGCPRFPTANTSSKIALPLSISPIDQELLILYQCSKPPAPAEGLVETRCGNGTFARVTEPAGDSYFLEGCDAIVVPVRGGSGKANASNYEELISDGFLLTWEPSPPAGNPIIQSMRLNDTKNDKL